MVLTLCGLNKLLFMTQKKEVELSAKEQKDLIDQVQNEFDLSWDYTYSKRQDSLKRLKLYNNQKKDKSKVGDPLLFTVFQTVFAELYEDKMAVRFEGNEEGDEETAENLNAMAKFDHSKMEKDEADYEWDWDSCFFGRGLMLLNEFDTDKSVPVSEVIDPMTFIRDPRASSINGNQKGYGKARFFGREIGLTKSEMEDHPSYFNTGKLKKDKDTKSLTDEAKEARRTAQGLENVKMKEEALTENYEYQLLEWWTHIDGKKYIVTLANNRQVIVRHQEIEEDKWPIIDRTLFPISHDWDGVSIPDLIEDKQRARAVMINLGMESAKADLYPMYLFDKNKIKNEKDLDFDFNKFIPINGDVGNAITPIQKSVFHQQVNLILNILDTAAQKSVAAPEVSQGVQPSQSRTLGETELVMAGKNVRHSLGTRIFGWSERRFWRQWYWIYKRDFKEGIGEKIVRIQGALNPVWRTLTRENLISDIDPDVYIESASIVEAERQSDFQEFSAFTQIALQDPSTNRRYVLRKLGKISRLSKVEMMMMFPLTIDEMRADDENRKLDDNELPKIDFYDDDIIHLEIHNKAADTGAKMAHIEAHKMIMFMKKKNPELMPIEQEQMRGYSPVNSSQGQPQEQGNTQPVGVASAQQVPTNEKIQ